MCWVSLSRFLVVFQPFKLRLSEGFEVVGRIEKIEEGTNSAETKLLARAHEQLEFQFYRQNGFYSVTRVLLKLHMVIKCHLAFI